MSRETRRVAVVVFCEAPGVDDRDAGTLATIAVRKALGAGGRLGPDLEPITVTFYNPDQTIRREPTVQPVDVMEVGLAAGNGYLWTRTTSKSFRENGRDEETDDA